MGHGTEEWAEVNSHRDGESVPRGLINYTCHAFLLCETHLHSLIRVAFPRWDVHFKR